MYIFKELQKKPQLDFILRYQRGTECTLKFSGLYICESWKKIYNFSSS